MDASKNVDSVSKLMFYACQNRKNVFKQKNEVFLTRIHIDVITIVVISPSLRIPATIWHLMDGWDGRMWLMGYGAWRRLTNIRINAHNFARLTSLACPDMECSFPSPNPLPQPYSSFSFGIWRQQLGVWCENSYVLLAVCICIRSRCTKPRDYNVIVCLQQADRWSEKTEESLDLGLFTDCWCTCHL